MKKFSVGQFIFYFAVLGGFIGGLIMGIGALLMDLKSLETSILYIFSPLIIGFFGVFLGFLPALFTAIWLNFRKIVLSHWQSYVEVWVTGFVVTLLCEICILGFGKWQIYMLLPATLGGISAVLTSQLLLPKTQFKKGKTP